MLPAVARHPVITTGQGVHSTNQTFCGGGHLFLHSFEPSALIRHRRGKKYVGAYIIIRPNLLKMVPECAFIKIGAIFTTVTR
jgi:hypothetical protein